MPLNHGLDLKLLSEKEQRRILAGMRSPKVEPLHVGQILYHFGSTEGNRKGHGVVAVPPPRWAAGPWWFHERDYRRIYAEYLDSQLSLGLVGRSALAIQQSYSRVDVLVEAVVVKEINAFTGDGRPQHREMAPNGMFFTLPGWPGIMQIYIPNIVDRRTDGVTTLNALGREALDVRSQGVIQSQQLYRLGR